MLSLRLLYRVESVLGLLNCIRLQEAITSIKSVKTDLFGFSFL